MPRAPKDQTPDAARQSSGVREDKISLESGEAVFRCPREMSAEERSDVAGFLESLASRIKRAGVTRAST